MLLAGAIAARLTDHAAAELNDQAAIARAAWLQAIEPPRSAPGAAIAPRPQLSAALAKTLRETQGGRNLIRLGLADDLEDAAAVDRHQLVPWFDPHTGRIGVRI